MLKRFDYECPAHGVFEETVEGYVGQQPCPRCGESAPKIMSATVIHTLETHFRGFRGDGTDNAFKPGEGSYRDENLTDKAGNAQTYSSLSERRRLLEKHGLYEKGPIEKNRRRRSQRPMYFTAKGSKRSQLGIN